MRPRIITLIFALSFLLGTSFFAVGPAAAGPAEPFNDRVCETYIDQVTGDVYESCAYVQGVNQYTETRSGLTKRTTQGNFTFSVSVNGEQLESNSERFNRTSVVRDGETQVYHLNERSSSTFIDRETGIVTTCTHSIKLVQTNGEVRLEFEDFDCSSS